MHNTKSTQRNTPAIVGGGLLLSVPMHFVESYLMRIINFSTSYLFVLFYLPRGIVAQIIRSVKFLFRVFHHLPRVFPRSASCKTFFIMLSLPHQKHTGVQMIRM